MRLVHDKTQQEVEIGDIVASSTDLAIVRGFAKPRTTASTGRIHVDSGEFFPHVYGCTWIEREDR